MLKESTRKGISFAVSLFVIAALAVPGIALAKGGNGGNGKGKPAASQKQTGSRADSSATEGDAAVQVPAKDKAARNAGKAERKAAKAARKSEKAARKAARKAPVVSGSAAEESSGAPDPVVDPADEASGSVDASTPVEADEGKGPGIENALSSITRNLEKSLAKIADGRKKQLPPGLVKVWQKFALWLGVDLTTQPGYVAPPVDPTTVEPTSTVEPTATVEPTSTVEPTPTVEPTATVDPTPTVEPTATTEPGDAPA